MRKLSHGIGEPARWRPMWMRATNTSSGHEAIHPQRGSGVRLGVMNPSISAPPANGAPIGLPVRMSIFVWQPTQLATLWVR